MKTIITGIITISLLSSQAFAFEMTPKQKRNGLASIAATGVVAYAFDRSGQNDIAQAKTEARDLFLKPYPLTDEEISKLAKHHLILTDPSGGKLILDSEKSIKRFDKIRLDTLVDASRTSHLHHAQGIYQSARSVYYERINQYAHSTFQNAPATSSSALARRGLGKSRAAMIVFVAGLAGTAAIVAASGEAEGSSDSIEYQSVEVAE